MHQRTISLVLGSGGARGMAHIGVIRWLKKHDYEIVSLAGSSIGALVGGIYAAGKLDEFEEWVCEIDRLDILRLLDFTWDKNGLVRGDRVIETLRNIVGDRLIEDLPLKFTAVATDLHNEKEVWFSSGPLFDAIRASISLPLFFTPFRHAGVDLIDGGVLNPVPIAPTFSDQTEQTLAVNLEGTIDHALPGTPDKEATTPSGSPLREKLQAFLEDIGVVTSPREAQPLNARHIATQTIDAMQSTIARQKLAAYPPDKVIDIPRNACSVLEFDRARELIDIGYRRAGECLGNNT